MSTAPPPLAADLTDGLERLKLAAMRRVAPELLITAKTQRWSPEDFLRTLVTAEITARDESNARTRMRSAAFPVTKTLAEFDVAVSSIPTARFDYLASLEWIRGAENVCLIGPAGTGKSHMLVALGVTAAYERRALGIGSHWPFESWGRFFSWPPPGTRTWPLTYDGRERAIKGQQQ